MKTKIHKNILKNLWASLKPALLRFPALFVLGLVVAVCISLNSSSWELFNTSGLDSDSMQWKELVARREAFNARMLSFILPGCWGMVLSVLLQLLCERLPAQWLRGRPRLTKLLPPVVQGALVLLALFPASLCFMRTDSRTWLVFWGVLIALCAGIVFVLMRRYQPGIVVPNGIIAGIVASIACGCVVAGLELIYLAVTQLIFKVPDPADSIITALLGFIPFFVLFWGLFVAYATRAEEEMVIPKAYRVIMLMILLPLYVVLLAVLYAYLLKSLVTLTMPSGKINPFVSFATAFYIFFCFAVAPYQTRFTELFKKICPFVLIPLVAVQCMAFALRVSAYGFTQARVASLLYILFSICCIVLVIVRQGRLMHWAPAALAVCALIGSVSPLNIMDSTLRSQSGRIFRVYRTHGLLSSAGGTKQLVAEGAAAALSGEEKALVVDAWGCIDPEETPRPWMERARVVNEDTSPEYKMKGGELVAEPRISYSFERLFGFPYSWDYGQQHGYKLAYRTDSSDKPLDVSQFQSVWKLELELRHPETVRSASNESTPPGERRITVGYGATLPDGSLEHSYDITEEIRRRLKRYDWDESLGRIADAPDRDERIFLTMPDGITLVLTHVSLSESYMPDGQPERYTGSASISGYACR